MWFGVTEGASMVEINLYPWRDQQSQYEKRATRRILVIVSAFTMIMLIVVHMVMSDRLENLKQEVVSLQETLNAFDQEEKQIKTEPEVAIDSSKNKITHQAILLLEALEQKPICLTQMERVKNSFIYSGEASSMSVLVDFLSNWDVENTFYRVAVDSLRHINNGEGIAFRLRAQVNKEEKMKYADTL